MRSVERMAIRDEDVGANLTLVEGDDDILSSPEKAPTCAPHDLRSLYEWERARADGAEARCEELRRAEGIVRLNFLGSLSLSPFGDFRAQKHVLSGLDRTSTGDEAGPTKGNF